MSELLTPETRMACNELLTAYSSLFEDSTLAMCANDTLVVWAKSKGYNLDGCWDEVVVDAVRIAKNNEFNDREVLEMLLVMERTIEKLTKDDAAENVLGDIIDGESVLLADIKCPTKEEVLNIGSVTLAEILANWTAHVQ